ncbi:hypothetical protein D3C72_1719200 [compost metagenome]
MTTPELLRKMIFNIAPGDTGDQNSDHSALVVNLGKLWDEYHASCKPRLDAIHAVLGIQSLDPELVEYRRAARYPDMQTDIHNRGQGAFDYARQVLIDQTHIDPRFAVLKLEAESLRFGINNLRMPAGNGMDIMYSRDPLPDYPGFDNTVFIPALHGYYGIVGTGGARD